MALTGGSVQEAVDAHLRELYGDARKRTALFAESAAQLQLEAMAEDAGAATEACHVQPRQQSRPPPPGANALAARLAPGHEPNATPLWAPRRAIDAKTNGVRRMAPQKVIAAIAPQPPFSGLQGRTANAAQQGALGHRALGGPGNGAAGSLTGSEALLREAAAGQARPRIPIAAPARPGAAQPGTQAALAEPTRVPAVPAIQSQTTIQLDLRPPIAAQRLSVNLGPDEMGLEGVGTGRMLEAVNPAAGAPGSACSHLVCSSGTERLWDVALHGQVAALCGGPNFAAAAMQSGTVEV